MDNVKYTGFWIRFIASIIDSVLLSFIIWPLLFFVYGGEIMANPQQPPQLGMAYYLITVVLPIAAILVFWIYKSATPGKMIFSAKIVDAKTGGKPSVGQFIGRYFAYFVSIIPLFLGFLWIAFDSRKQGWHDKLAGTVVVRR